MKYKIILFNLFVLFSFKTYANNFEVGLNSNIEGLKYSQGFYTNLDYNANNYSLDLSSNLLIDSNAKLYNIIDLDTSYKIYRVKSKLKINYDNYNKNFTKKITINKMIEGHQRNREYDFNKEYNRIFYSLNNNFVTGLFYEDDYKDYTYNIGLGYEDNYRFSNNYIALLSEHSYKKDNLSVKGNINLGYSLSKDTINSLDDKYKTNLLVDEENIFKIKTSIKPKISIGGEVEYKYNKNLNIYTDINMEHAFDMFKIESSRNKVGTELNVAKFNNNKTKFNLKINGDIVDNLKYDIKIKDNFVYSNSYSLAYVNIEMVPGFKIYSKSLTDEKIYDNSFNISGKLLYDYTINKVHVIPYLGIDFNNTHNEHTEYRVLNNDDGTAGSTPAIIMLPSSNGKPLLDRYMKNESTLKAIIGTNVVYDITDDMWLKLDVLLAPSFTTSDEYFKEIREIVADKDDEKYIPGVYEKHNPMKFSSLDLIPRLEFGLKF